MSFVALEKLHRLYDGYLQAFNVQGHQLLLLQDGNDLHLIENQCPHMDAPLTYAKINHGYLRCPVHGIEFSLQNGAAKNGIGGCLKRYQLAYEGNQVGVCL